MSVLATRDTPFTEIAVAESEGLSPPEYSCQTNNNHINANEPPPPYASLNGNVITQQPYQAQAGANNDILQPSSGQELSTQGSEGCGVCCSECCACCECCGCGEGGKNCECCDMYENCGLPCLKFCACCVDFASDGDCL